MTEITRHRRRRRKTDWLLIAIQLATGVGAILAIVIAVTSVQTSRRDSAADLCRTMRTIVYAATPHKDRAEGIAFVRRIGLGNCDAYANRITNGH